MDDELMDNLAINRNETYLQLGFISNAEEEAYMMSDEGKNELVASIFKAFKRYKLLYDERSKVSFGRHEEEPVKVEEPVDPIISYGIQIASTSTKLESLPTEYGEVKVYEEQNRRNQCKSI